MDSRDTKQWEFSHSVVSQQAQPSRAILCLDRIAQPSKPNHYTNVELKLKNTHSLRVATLLSRDSDKRAMFNNIKIENYVNFVTIIKWVFQIAHIQQKQNDDCAGLITAQT